MTQVLARLAFLVLRIIEPVYPVRFVPILASRIGHCAGDVDLLLRTKTKRGLVFFAVGPVANQALLDLWKQKLPVITGGWLLRFLGQLYPMIKGTRFILPFTATGQEYRAWHKPGPLASYDLPKPIAGEFVLFHARDSAYLGCVGPNSDFSYHDFRDASIKSMLPAAEHITERGFQAVRMGSIVAEPLHTTNDKIIDYPKCHSDDMDLWLSRHCKFYIGTNNGTAQLPLLFDKPLAYTNSVPLWMLNWGKDSLFIPKLFRAKGSDSFLTFTELQKLGAFDHEQRNGLHTKWYAGRGIEPVENTPEDILDLCKDMFDLLDGNGAVTRGQLEYKSRFFRSQHERDWAPNIGPSFIAKYESLIG